MPVRSPLTSVMPALSIATSAPVPMAMPTSAAASAGASLTPSPAIATLAPPALQLLDQLVLALGRHVGADFVDARASSATAFAVRSLSPVAMTISQALRVQRADRLGGRRLDRIGDRDDADQPAVDGDEHGGLALGAQRRRPACSHPRRRRPARPSSPRCRAPRRGRPPCPSRPCRSTASKSSAAEIVAPRASAPCHDRLGDRMLRAALQAGRQRQQVGLVDALDRDHVGQLRLALGQRAGLVDDQRVDTGEALQRLRRP